MSRKGMYKKAVEYYMPPSQTQTIYSDYKGPNTSNNTKIGNKTLGLKIEPATATGICFIKSSFIDGHSTFVGTKISQSGF